MEGEGVGFEDGAARLDAGFSVLTRSRIPYSLFSLRLVPWTMSFWVPALPA